MVAAGIDGRRVRIGARQAGVTGFAFAGGAMLGSIQVGMLRALFDAGIWPDVITATSSGALNGAMVASDPSADSVGRLANLWLTSRRSQILPIRPRELVRGLRGRSDHLAGNAGLREVIETHIPITRFEQARVPFHVVAADTASREKVVLSHGDIGAALLATTAIPGIYPPVEIDGRFLVDGGLAEDPPLGTAIEQGATTVYVLPVGWPLDPAPANGAGSRAMDALDWLFWRVAKAELDRWAGECRLYVVPSPPIQGVFPLSPSSSRVLVDRAEHMTRRWLPTARRWPSSGTHPPTGLDHSRTCRRGPSRVSGRRGVTSPNPVWYASTTAWTRSRRSSFWSMCVMWVLTVVSLM
jgi:NTE family protein